jgi:hypothetical protein
VEGVPVDDEVWAAFRVNLLQSGQHSTMHRRQDRSIRGWIVRGHERQEIGWKLEQTKQLLRVDELEVELLPVVLRSHVPFGIGTAADSSITKELPFPKT